MRSIPVALLLLAVTLAGCVPPHARPYPGWGIPTLATTAAGAAIGYNIGPRGDRGRNAVLGGLLGAMTGVVLESAAASSYYGPPGYGPPPPPPYWGPPPPPPHWGPPPPPPHWGPPPPPPHWGPPPPHWW